MKQHHYLLSFFALLLLIFIVIRYGTPSRKENPVTMPCVRYDTIEQYHIDSTGRYLLRWNGDTVGKTKKNKYENIEP